MNYGAEPADQVVRYSLEGMEYSLKITGNVAKQVVKSRFLKLDSSHIEYVFHAMKECPSNIRNIRAYLLTTLYNAPATMDNFYSAKVNHDFNGW